MQPKVTYRIGAGKKGVLLVIAVIADGIQVLFKFLWFTGILAILSEAVGWAMSGLASFLLILSFSASGVQPMQGAGGKARVMTAMVLEAMPLINAAPTFTIMTLLTIRQSRVEDQEAAAQSATIRDREEALRRGPRRRMQEPSAHARPAGRMRAVLRNIPHPVFRVVNATRAARPIPRSGAPEKKVS